MTRRKRYSAEFKREAIRRVECRVWTHSGNHVVQCVSLVSREKQPFRYSYPSGREWISDHQGTRR
jgi:hypothetical protein